MSHRPGRYTLPVAVGLIAHYALLACGVTATMFALFLGKLLAAAVLAALSLGAALRFKRGRLP